MVCREEFTHYTQVWMSIVTFRCSVPRVRLLSDVPRVHIRLLSDVLFHGYGYFQMFCSTIMVTFRCSVPAVWSAGQEGITDVRS